MRGAPNSEPLSAPMPRHWGRTFWLLALTVPLVQVALRLCAEFVVPGTVSRFYWELFLVLGLLGTGSVCAGWCMRMPGVRWWVRLPLAAVVLVVYLFVTAVAGSHATCSARSEMLGGDLAVEQLAQVERGESCG